jgi:hypothetical protein
MKTSLTLQDIASMDDETFLEHYSKYPLGSQYEYAESFRYCATRLARMQGLTIQEQTIKQ